jgi:hypothetical protein
MYPKKSKNLYIKKSKNGERMKKKLLLFAMLLNTESIVMIASEKTTTEKSTWAKLKGKAAKAVDATKAKLKPGTTTTKKKTEVVKPLAETRTIYWRNEEGQIQSIKPSDVRYESLLKNIKNGSEYASFDKTKLLSYQTKSTSETSSIGSSKEPIIYYKNSAGIIETHTPDSEMYFGLKMLLDMNPPSPAVSTNRSKLK